MLFYFQVKDHLKNTTNEDGIMRNLLLALTISVFSFASVANDFGFEPEVEPRPEHVERVLEIDTEITEQVEQLEVEVEVAVEKNIEETLESFSL